MSARALWCIAPSRAEVRSAAEGDGIAVDTLFTGISRGTERLVFEGRVPGSETRRMRAPAQEGDFPFPVKYGYCAVGIAREGAHEGREVFALHPHQTRFRMDAAMLTPLPDGLPAKRAILGANMETALNILWDGGAAPGDRIAVIGAGVIGALTGYLAARIPGTEVTLVDSNSGRAGLAGALGCGFAVPDDAEGRAPRECDLVIHATATAEGLALALDCAGQDAAVVEASWHGTGTSPVPLGGAFHSRRLRLVSSQVGHVPPARAPRWSLGRRMAKALELLRDPALDALISGETQFDDLPQTYGAILADPATLCHRIRYATQP
ncbi:MAG: zinc-binding alcohol dehydrogenase [Roseovarius sp.]